MAGPKLRVSLKGDRGKLPIRPGTFRRTLAKRRPMGKTIFDRFGENVGLGRGTKSKTETHRKGDKQANQTEKARQRHLPPGGFRPSNRRTNDQGAFYPLGRVKFLPGTRLDPSQVIDARGRKLPNAPAGLRRSLTKRSR